MAKPSKVSKFFKTLLIVLMVLIMAFAVAINVLFMKSSSAPFNNSIYIMQQSNMNDVQYGDAVISSASKVSELKAGNVVLCLTSYDNEYKEVLKLIDVTQEDGTTYYYVKSDEDAREDALKLTQDRVLAKCLWTNASLGKVITFAKSTIGIGTLVAIPCLVLLIIFISSTVAQQKEAQKEEELRKSNSKKAKKRKQQHTEQSETVNPKEAESDAPKEETPTKDSKEEPTVNKVVDPDEFFNKPVNKPITVNTLSQEESVRQRENASNIVGSELSSATIEIVKDLKSENIKVSPMSHINAVKIDEEPQGMEEDVHSPNMTEKANQIRQALSNDGVSNGDINAPVVAIIPPTTAETTTEVAPIEPTNVVETAPSVEPEPIATTDTPVQTEATPVATAINVDEPIIFNEAKPIEEIPTTTTSADTLNDDDFLDDILGTSNDTHSSTKVSDDLLDELLNSIPSTTQSTETTTRKATAVASSKTATKRSTTKTEHHTTKATTRHHKSSSKVTDDTSFDELLKAIEKEKHGIK